MANLLCGESSGANLPCGEFSGNPMNNRNLIERKSHVKYLGVIIDDTLLWGPHMTQVCSKISRGSFAILKLRK